MKMKKIKKTNTMKIVLGLSGIIFVILVAVTLSSRAKYRVTESIQIVNGTVTYKPADLTLVSLNVEESAGTGNYIKTKVPPTGSYKINTDKTYCTVGNNGTQLKTIPIEYKDGKLYIGINDTNTKCYVWLDAYIPTAEDTVKRLEIPLGSGTPNFAKTSCSNGCGETTNGLYSAEDDFGTSYYFRGSVDYNWVKFGKVKNADIWWRIIRINGNGTIRLIYAGTSSTSNAPATEGTGTQIGTSTFNDKQDNVKYAKYMYDTDIKDSTIKKAVDNWYTTTSNLHDLEDYIDKETGFCNDADTASSNNYFKPYDRLYTKKIPSFICNSPKTNLFTVNGDKGNNELTYPIGLITGDEVHFAGANWNTGNDGFYLNTNKRYWTLSPASFSNSVLTLFQVGSAGKLRYEDSITTEAGVRPVINLKADTKFQEGGDGSKDNPYVVVI